MSEFADLDIDVVVVGAGLAGLATAHEISSAGRSVLVLEASDGPGGRVRTDQVDGFRIDRGFQILLTAYPEAQRLLDYSTLDLQPFLPGAAVRTDKGESRLSDPFRRPKDLLGTITSPVGSPLDKLRILQFRRKASAGSLDELWARPEMGAGAYFKKVGFSDKMVEQFLGPLFAGITLDSELTGSSRMIEFVFRMLSAGDAAVPAKGMGAISAQLAGKLGDTVACNRPVRAVDGTTVTTADGETIRAGAVVVATDMNAAEELVGVSARAWNGVTSVWYDAPVAPTDDPVIVLNGTGRGAVNNLAVMSNVSDRYSPDGRHLVVVSAPSVDPELLAAMEADLAQWYPGFGDWTRLTVQQIPRSQPVLAPGTGNRPINVADGVFLAGDHRTDASINGALVSGTAAAKAALAHLGS